MMVLLEFYLVLENVPVSACKSTSKSVRPRFSVTETRVPSFGSTLPVFGDLIVLVKFNFSPGCIRTLYSFI
jgi:hypothetical protein